MCPIEPPNPQRQDSIERIKATLRTWFPGGRYGPCVHRDHLADAFAAGMRAAVTVDVPDEDVADEFEAYCEETFSADRPNGGEGRGKSVTERDCHDSDI